MSAIVLYAVQLCTLEVVDLSHSRTMIFAAPALVTLGHAAAAEERSGAHGRLHPGVYSVDLELACHQCQFESTAHLLHDAHIAKGSCRLPCSASRRMNAAEATTGSARAGGCRRAGSHPALTPAHVVPRSGLPVAQLSQSMPHDGRPRAGREQFVKP